MSEAGEAEQMDDQKERPKKRQREKTARKNISR